MATQTFVGTLTIIDCALCGLPFGITRDFEQRRRNDHATFYCPSGHKNYFGGKSEAEREKERADTAERNLRYARASRDAAQDQARAAERSAAAYKGHATRIRNMVAAGICPVPGCRRNFANLREHMSTEHPDYHKHEVSA